MEIVQKYTEKSMDKEEIIEYCCEHWNKSNEEWIDMFLLDPNKWLSDELCRAICFDRGLFCSTDKNEAKKIYESMLPLKNASVYFLYGQLINDIAYIKLAAEQLFAPAMLYLVRLNLKDELIEKQLKQLAEQEKENANYYKDSLRNETTRGTLEHRIKAMLDLAKYYDEPSEMSYLASYWYDQAAQLNNYEAICKMFKRAQKYELSGSLLLEHALFKRAKKAADIGVAEACDFVGMMYWNGEGTPVDLNEAERYLREAWKLKCEKSYRHLGLFLLNEKKNFKEAMTLLKTDAMEQGCFESLQKCLETKQAGYEVLEQWLRRWGYKIEDTPRNRHLVAKLFASAWKPVECSLFTRCQSNFYFDRRLLEKRKEELKREVELETFRPGNLVSLKASQSFQLHK